MKHLPDYKRRKYNKLMVNIIARLSVFSRIIENEIKDFNIFHHDFESNIKINYIRK